MAISIRHLEGPLAGREQHFDDKTQTIVFGREPDCDVVYPPDCSIVGKRHCALSRRQSGDYDIEIYGKRYVAMDGVPADNLGTPVKSGSTIRLGGPDGPSFEVEFETRRSRVHDTSMQPSSKGWFSNWGRADEAEAAPRPERRMEPEPSPPRPPPQPGPQYLDTDADWGISRYPDTDYAATALLTMRRMSHAVPSGARDAHRPEVVASSLPSGYAQSSAPYRPRPEGPFQSKAESSAPVSGGGRFGAIWWTLAALGLGALGYYLYRKGFTVGALPAGLVPAVMPPPPSESGPPKDMVEASVFGPAAVEAGRECLIQVLLHQLDQREMAKALAAEADPDASRRGVQTLSAPIAPWQHVQVLLEGRGLFVRDAMESLVWRGEPCSCQFTVIAPKESAGTTFHPRALVLADGVPIGSLCFTLKATAERPAMKAPEIKGDTARRYNYAFLSYASPDRAEVIKRAQGIKAGGTRFFNDLLSLEPGERWEKRLYEEIDRCDVVYLFWSSRAKASKWVMKEVEYALARRAASRDGAPDIIPVIIEGPPPPEPPEHLKDIHFNDALLYVLADASGVPARH